MNDIVKNVARWLISHRVARLIGGRRMAKVSMLIGVINTVRSVRSRTRAA